jgi:DNA-nicking Smr family endonuclease|tara:strand:- start:333 stop:755 length:423 start_codon:yes stop_codon:yes gene_type:complete
VKRKKDHLTQLDLEEWKKYVKNPKDIFDKEINAKNIKKNFKRYKFDLHGFTLLEANQKVKEIIKFCIEKGHSEILLITGKGLHSNTDDNTYVSKDLSKLRYSIPNYINTNPDLLERVSNISTAETKDGGDGALIIKLKKL